MLTADAALTIVCGGMAHPGNSAASDCRELDRSTIELLLSDAREFLATLEAAGLVQAAGGMTAVVELLAASGAQSAQEF